MARLRGWRAIWLKVTLCRHRSELGALDLARKCGPLAIFPIGATVCFWWLAIGLPASVPGMIGLALIESDEPSWRLVAVSLYMISSLSALIVLCVAAPWFFRWYFIAVSLMFGRHAMADRKKAELVDAIAAEEEADRFA